MSTGHRGPLLFSQTDSPLDGIPLDLAQGITGSRSGVGIGGSALYLGPQAAGTGGGWTLAEVGSGSVKQNHEGALVLTTATTDEDHENLQFLNRAFRYSATRKIACFARVKVSTDVTTDALFGIAASDTTLITAAAQAVDVADGIFFYKVATATDWTVHVRASSTSTTATTGLTIASDTYMIIGFTVIGGAIRWYAKADSADGLLTGPSYLGNGTAIANTNAPATTTDLFLSLAVGQEGGTTARALTVDGAFCVEWDA